jgi:hypothetical protein
MSSTGNSDVSKIFKEGDSSIPQRSGQNKSHREIIPTHGTQGVADRTQAFVRNAQKKAEEEGTYIHGFTRPSTSEHTQSTDQATYKNLKELQKGYFYIIRELKKDPLEEELDQMLKDTNKLLEQTRQLIDDTDGNVHMEDAQKNFGDLHLMRDLEKNLQKLLTNILEKKIDENFMNTFIANIEDKDFFDNLDLAESFNRHMTVNDAKRKGGKNGKEWAREFAIAKGMASEEKSSLAPYSDTTKIFKNRYTPDVKQGMNSAEHLHHLIGNKNKNDFFEVKLQIEQTICHTIYVNPKEGEFIVVYAHRDVDKEIQREGTHPLQLYDLLYHSQRLAIQSHNEKNAGSGKIDENNLKLTKVTHHLVENKESMATAYLFIQPNELGVFTKKDREFFGMLGTPNCSGASYLPKQHKDSYSDKKVSKIEVETGDKYTGTVLDSPLPYIAIYFE